MNINSVIYPYNEDMNDFIIGLNMYSKYKVNALVSYKGWGQDKKNIIIGDEEYYVTTDLEKSLNECNTIISQIPFSVKSYDEEVQNIVNTCIDNKKNLVLVNPVLKANISKYQKIFDKNNLSLVAFELDRKGYDEKYSKMIDIEDVVINIPIVSIYSLGEKCEQYRIQRQIKDYFTNNGYNVVVISTSCYAEIVGDFKYPEFVYSGTELVSKKIIEIKKYINRIIDNNNANLLIVEIPDGIMPLNKYLNNEFGWKAFLLSQALPPDYVILSLYSDIYDEEYLNKINLFMKYRFGSEVDSFYMSSTKLNWEHIFDPMERYSILNSDKLLLDLIQKNKKNTKIDFYYKNTNKDTIGKIIEKKLSSFGELEIF